MGLPEDVQVIAWGLGLERYSFFFFFFSLCPLHYFALLTIRRPTMILYKIENIRDLLGPRVSIPSIQSNPICRLDKVRK
jgi:phenylalanyl-tRNA synthetase alpha chain